MRGRFSRARVAVLAVAALVLLDVALVAGAFGSVRSGHGPVSSAPITSEASTTPTPVAGQVSPTTQSTTLTTPTPTTTAPTTPTTTAPTALAPTPTVSTAPTPTASATQQPPAPSSEQQRLLVALDGTSAWRIVSGVCGSGGAVIETTADGGATWVQRTSPFPVLNRVRPASGTTAFVVGANADCAMGVRQTGDSGQHWSDAGGLGSTWALDTRDRTMVRVPIDQTATPCGREVVLELVRATASTAQVLCAGGQVLQSGDEGRTWTAVVRIAGALTLDNRVESGTVTAYVVAPGSGCAGLAVSAARRAAVARVGCVVLDQKGLTAGAVSLSIVGDQGWLLVGETTWRSRDGLRTWSRI